MLVRFMLMDGEFVAPIHRVVLRRSNRLVAIDYIEYGNRYIDIFPFDRTFQSEPLANNVRGRYYLFFDFPYIVLDKIFRPIPGIDENDCRGILREYDRYDYPFIMYHIRTVHDRYDLEIPVVKGYDYMGDIDRIVHELVHRADEIEDLWIKLHIPLLPEKGKLMMRDSFQREVTG